MQRLYTLISTIGTFIATWTEEQKLYAWSCIVLGMLFFVPNNTILLFVACICAVGVYVLWKNVILAILYTYLLFLPFPNGKSASFILVPVNLMLQRTSFTANVSASVSNFMCAILLYLYIRDRFVLHKKMSTTHLGYSDAMIYIFFLATCIATAFSNIPFLSFLLTLQFAGYIFVYYFIRTNHLQHWIFRITLPLMTSLCSFEGLWSILQFANNSPLGKSIEGTLSPVLHGASEDLSFFRMQGTFNHPNYLGFFMAMLLPWLFYFSISKHISYFGKVISTIAVIACLAGLLLSEGRASWFIGATAIIFVLRTKTIQSSLKILHITQRLYISFFACLLIGIPLFVIPRISQFVTTIGSTGGLQFRLYLLQLSFTTIAQHPLGIGLGTFPNVLLELIKVYTFPPTEVHNLIAQAFLSSGIIGGISFCGLLYLTIRRSFWRIHNMSPNLAILPSVGVISLGSFLALSMVYPVLTEPSIISWLWILLSVVV